MAPLARLKINFDRSGDVAALVEAVRVCRDSKTPPTGWVVDGLEALLSVFIATATPPKWRPAAFDSDLNKWARTCVKAYGDWIVLDRVESAHDEYGLTWIEARDEASCWFRGTRLALSPDGIKKACQRARARERAGWRLRGATHFELHELNEYLDPARGPSDWWIVNSDRVGDTRGEWKERPRLLAHLEPQALARAVRKRKGEWGLKLK